MTAVLYPLSLLKTRAQAGLEAGQGAALV
jgi:hypothetical protein